MRHLEEIKETIFSSRLFSKITKMVSRMDSQVINMDKNNGRKTRMTQGLVD
jgi:hypothetical protein